MGFSLMDVDIVLISHAHPDHLWDFESMVQLLHELQVKTHKIHQLNVVLTLGSYHRLSHIINNPGLRRFINPLVIDIRKEIEPDFFKKLAPPKKNKTPQDQGQKLNLLNYCFSFSPKVKDEKIVVGNLICQETKMTIATWKGKLRFGQLEPIMRTTLRYLTASAFL